MKITLDVDCTPAEAREFFGLPDLRGVNEIVTDELARRTRENIDTLADPKAFWDRAFLQGGAGLEAFSRLFAQPSRDGGE